MLEVTFGKMYKRTNSTKTAFTDALTLSVSLKDSVDITSPVFLLNQNVSKYNYCSLQYEEGGIVRYYYIDKVTIVHAGLFEVSCHMDILATYKRCFTYGLYGKVLYSTDETLWDEYVDDMRFAPTHLDTYSVNWSTDESYLYTHENVFGNGLPLYTPRLWDCTYDQDGNVTDYGDGCFIVQVSAPHGPINYLMSKAGLYFFCDVFLNSMSHSSHLASIKILNHLPLRFSELKDDIKGATAATEVFCGYDKSDDAPPTGSTYEIPSTCVLSYDGGMDIPTEWDAHPLFMENARWNNLQLKTPSGVTEVNLDMCYPASGSGRGLHFRTMLDVVSGTVSTKYSYDCKEYFTDLKGSVIYESVFTCANDILSLVQRSSSMSDAALSAGMAGLGLASAMYTGGASMALVGAGMAVGKAVTDTNRRTSAYNTGSSLASFYNTNQLGLIGLRLKPFRCRELTTTGKSMLQVYKDYCAEHGYPANVQELDGAGFKTDTYYVVEDPHFAMDNAYFKTYSAGMDDRMQEALLKVAASGIWIE